MTNKFNIHWQIVRVKLRQVKDVRDKINAALKFLNDNKNAHNYERVLNWLKTTKMGYSGAGSDTLEKFDGAVVYLKRMREEGWYSSSNDTDNDLSKVPHNDLQMVYKDLQKRKYGFQFKTPPKDHVAFMEDLKKALQL